MPPINTSVGSREKIPLVGSIDVNDLNIHQTAQQIAAAAAISIPVIMHEAFVTFIPATFNNRFLYKP